MDIYAVVPVHSDHKVCQQPSCAEPISASSTQLRMQLCSAQVSVALQVGTYAVFSVPTLLNLGKFVGQIPTRNAAP